VKLVVGAADGQIPLFQQRLNGPLVPDGEPIEAHRGAAKCVAWRPFAGFARTEIATYGSTKWSHWTFSRDGIQNGAIWECDEEPVDLKWSPCGFVLSVSSGLTTVELWRESDGREWRKLEIDD
jgi:hypothetical protein